MVLDVHIKGKHNLETATKTKANASPVKRRRISSLEACVEPFVQRAHCWAGGYFEPPKVPGSACVTREVGNPIDHKS